MTYIPDYLKTYPNMNTSSPLHISLNRLYHGFRPHRHDFLEFSYVIDGRGSESINDAKHQMLPGTFTFVLPYQVLGNLADSMGIEFVIRCTSYLPLLGMLTILLPSDRKAKAAV